MELRDKTSHIFLLLFSILLLLTGCATTNIASFELPPVVSPSLPGTLSQPPVVMTAPQVAGVYHEVVPGQTLWRIAKGYGVDTDAIVEANRLSDETQLKTGQRLFIPGAEKVLDVGVYKPAEEQPLEDFIWPVKNRITSLYGGRWGRKHAGVDIASPMGTPVKAAKSGRVLLAKNTYGGYGRLVIIDHGDGITTRYAHNSKILVKKGQVVEQGDAIAKVGSTGHSTGPHLHFEIRKKNKPQNPLYYLP